MAGRADETTPSKTDTPATPQRLLAAPGYLARRLYQAYLSAWVRRVDATLTGPQFAVLTAVGSYPGVDQGSLASSVALDRSTMADIVRRLEDRELVIRETAANDGRRKLLYLSDQGVAKLDEVNARALELDELLLADYSPGQRQRLLDEVTELAERWESL
jgi:DNA-binding MarR family transcriptional regulator